MERDIKCRGLLPVGLIVHIIEANFVIYRLSVGSMFVSMKSVTMKNISIFLFCYVCVCDCAPCTFGSLCECVHHRYLCVYVCIHAYPLTNDCCNNRQQSCKVRGLLVNNVQTTDHNPPVTRIKWTHSRTPQPELPPQTWPYNLAPTPFILLQEDLFCQPSVAVMHIYDQMVRGCKVWWMAWLRAVWGLIQGQN